MSAALTVSSTYMQYLLDAARDLGCDLYADLAQYGLSEAMLNSPEVRIPMNTEEAIFERILTTLNDPFFGLHMGEKVRPASAGAMGYATMSAPDLGSAVNVMLQYERYRSELAECTLEQHDDSFSIYWTPIDGQSEKHRHRVEAAFSAWLNFGRWITRSDASPRLVHFRHSQPSEDLNEYQRIFNCPVLFEQKDNRIELGYDLWSLPLADADEDIHRLTRERIEKLLSVYYARDDFLMRVRMVLAENIQSGTPSIEALAESLSMKTWTLRRRLSSEGTDFTQLLDQTRIELASKYLADAAMPISDIATRLGYSEQSAFNRAFKRWFDCTPATYRQQLKS